MDSTGSAWWAEPCNSALRSAESQSEPLPLLESPSATFSFAALERAVLCLRMNRPWAGGGGVQVTGPRLSWDLCPFLSHGASFTFPHPTLQVVEHDSNFRVPECVPTLPATLQGAPPVTQPAC